MDKLMVAAANPERGPAQTVHRAKEFPPGDLPRQLRKLHFHLEDLRAHGGPPAPLPEGFEVERNRLAGQSNCRFFALGVRDDIESRDRGYVVPRFGIVLDDERPLHRIDTLLVALKRVVWPQQPLTGKSEGSEFLRQVSVRNKLEPVLPPRFLLRLLSH